MKKSGPILGPLFRHTLSITSDISDKGTVFHTVDFPELRMFFHSSPHKVEAMPNPDGNHFVDSPVNFCSLFIFRKFFFGNLIRVSLLPFTKTILAKGDEVVFSSTKLVPLFSSLIKDISTSRTPVAPVVLEGVAIEIKNSVTILQDFDGLSGEDIFLDVMVKSIGNVCHVSFLLA